MTSTLLPKHTTFSNRLVNKPYKVHEGTNLLPCVIEHDSTTDRDSGFILHEIVECLFVVMTPLVEKGTSMEQHCGKLFERQ